MMAILRDHGDEPDWTPANTRGRTICMHAAEGPRRSQSVASMVSELRHGRFIHWVTGSSAPCTSLFKPVILGHAPPFSGAAAQDRFDEKAAWWRHERLHRRMLCDFGPALASIRAERDALESVFIARMDAVADAGLSDAIGQCWREAAAAEDRWLAALPIPTVGEPDSYRRSWRRLNQVAGFPGS
jgi:hypothetical protein